MKILKTKIIQQIEQESQIETLQFKTLKTPTKEWHKNLQNHQRVLEAYLNHLALENQKLNKNLLLSKQIGTIL